MPKIEESDARRKKVSDTVWKELFARSGNMCAMAHCSSQLFDSEGLKDVFIAHIRGVKGARHEPGLPDSVLNGVDNLMLLCNKHHNQVDTLPVAEFTVDRMREIKAAHEAKVRKFTDDLRGVVFDESRFASSTSPTSFARWYSHWDLNDPEEDEQPRHDVRVATEEHIARVRLLPPPARDLLAVIVDHGIAERSGLAGKALHIRVQALYDRATSTPMNVIDSQLKSLEEHELGWVDDSDYGDFRDIEFWSRSAEFDIAAEIQAFCRRFGFSVPELYEGQDWSILD